MAPGLQGTYEDSCIVCMRGTDTAIVFTGEAEWVIAAYVHLGIPTDQAEATVSLLLGCKRGMVPDGEVTVPTRVCQTCARSFPVGLLAEGQPLPHVHQV